MAPPSQVMASRTWTVLRNSYQVTRFPLSRTAGVSLLIKEKDTWIVEYLAPGVAKHVLD